MKNQLQAMMIAGIGILSIMLTYGQDLKAPGRLTIDQARELVKVSAPPKMLALPGFYLDYFARSYCLDFYYFDALWKNPGPIGSNLSARFAVNSRTGDVWEPDTPKRITSHELKKAQTAIRKRLGLSDAEFRKLSKKYPC